MAKKKGPNSKRPKKCHFSKRVMGQKLRRLKEKETQSSTECENVESEYTPRQQLECREKENVPEVDVYRVAFRSLPLQSRHILATLSEGTFFKVPMEKNDTVIIAVVCNRPSRSLLLRKKGKGRFARALNKLFENAILGKNVTFADVSNNPSPSVPSGRSVKKTVARVFNRLSANPLLRRNAPLANISDSPSLTAVIGRRRELTVAPVFNKPSASVLLGKNLSVPKTFNNPSLSAVIGRRRNIKVTCIAKKPPPLLLGRNKKSTSLPLDKNVSVPVHPKNPSVSAPQDGSEDVTAASAINNISGRLPSEQNENVAAADAFNRPPQRELSDMGGNAIIAKVFDTHQYIQSEKHGGSTIPKPTSRAKYKKRYVEASEGSIDMNQISVPQTTISNEICLRHQLEIQHSQEMAEKKFPTGRFIVDLKSVIRQARDIEAHTSKCNFGGKLLYYKTTREGLVYTFYYSCSNPTCGVNMKIVTDEGGEHLNRLAVLGAISTGSGFSREQEKFKVMNMRYMSKGKFSRLDNLTGQIVRSSDKATMTEDMTVGSKMPVLVEPKIEMDFCIDETSC